MEVPLTLWALFLAYAIPVGLILALLALLLRGRIERRRAAAADAELREIETALAMMDGEPQDRATDPNEISHPNGSAGDEDD